MIPILKLAVLSTTLLPAHGIAAVPGVEYQVRATYRVSLVRDTATQGSSTSTSHDADAILERVAAVDANGVVLDYDFPKTVSAEQRGPTWQLPVRVQRAADGSLRILDRSALEARADAWLKAAKLPRTACGQWYFTWNAFQVECDPESALRMVEAFRFASSDIREGAAYTRLGALESAVLVRKGATLVATLDIDPDAVRRERAKADVVVGTIMRKPVTEVEALNARAKERVSGTISVTFDLNADGSARRRTTVTRQETVMPNGETESMIATEVLVRERETIRR